MFILWPFGAFVMALKNGFNRHYQYIILAFSFLFGYSVYLFGGDILSYEERFYEVAKLNWAEFVDILIFKIDPFTPSLNYQYYRETNQKPDIYAFGLQFLVSRLSDSPRLFWGLVSLIYTKFFLLFINEVKQQFEIYHFRIYHLIFISFLIFVIPFYVAVTGVRFWTALLLFMFLLLKTTNSGKSKYIYFSLVTMLIHYSFFVPVSLLFIIYYLPLKKWITRFVVLFSIFFFITSSATGILSFIEEKVSVVDETSIGESMTTYTDVEYHGDRKLKAGQRNWYVRLRSDSLFYILVAAFLIEFFGITRLVENRYTKNLSPYLILFFAIALIGYNLGSMGRFKNIFYLLSMARYVIIFPLNYQSKYLKYLAVVLGPSLLLYVAVTFRAGFYFVDPLLLISNPIILFLEHSGESLSEFIVGH